MGYETETWRRPTVQEGDVVVFDEHGRSCNNVDFKSHWLMLVRQQYGGYALLVKHGGGEERIPLGFAHTMTGLLACDSLTSDQRYVMLYLLFDTHQEATRQAEAKTASAYKVAFVEKRLKKTMRNHRIYVSIVPRAQVEADAEERLHTTISQERNA